MAREHWDKIEKLYHAALELHPEARARFLDEACANDHALRTEVASLLDFHDAKGSFMESSAIEVTAKLLASKRNNHAGKQFGPYRILRLLGSGGMGDVYLAIDERLDRRVALKLLSPSAILLEDNLVRFQNEARAASAINHPNIVTIHEIGVIEEEHFIAAEFVDGVTLRQRLKDGAFAICEAVHIALQVASALAAAHQARIVHRDIKPENIMLRPDGYLKVLDFGVAKLDLSGLNAASLGRTPTLPGIVLGTVQYMSPEQARGIAADGRSDIFSLGAVFYELIAGRPAFQGSSVSDQIAALLAAEPVPPSFYAPVPSSLDEIIRKMLAKNPDGRYQTAGELAAALEAYRKGLVFEMELERWAATREAGPVDGRTLQQSQTALKLEPVGGAVPLDSAFYIPRAADEEFRTAVQRQDSIVLIKGARQVGKTSLLARGLEEARRQGARVVLTDFQSLDELSMETPERLLKMLAELIAEQLDLEVSPTETWKPHLSPGMNFERYLRREVIGSDPAAVVWGLDEVDRLFGRPYASEVFGLFRSWHNKRALDPSAPWQRFTMAIAYASEAHLFITDLNQSPFNVGTRLALEDFTLPQLEELNRRHGSPLRNVAECMRFLGLLGGNPYLVRVGLYEMAARGVGLAELDSNADRDDGPFGVHLRRLLFAVRQDVALCDALRTVLRGPASLNSGIFYRLRSAGVVSGNSPHLAQPRCQLYTRYLTRNLL